MIILENYPKEKIDKMKSLIRKLSEASITYYMHDNSIITDKEYDDLCDELENLEKETGVVFSESPIQKVQGYVSEGFKKVRHSKPMLSANKTKDINEIASFVGNNDYYCSYKLDGATTVAIYENGEFKQGITRGNGIIGEDVTDVCQCIFNLPMKIPYKKRLELRGETVVSWDEFNTINKRLQASDSDCYSHPRNCASGTLRNLDNNIVRDRHLSFVVFECVSGLDFDTKTECLDYLDTLGFETVERVYNKQITPIEMSKLFDPSTYKYPTDGLIFELNNVDYSKSLGSTAHHEKCRYALKWSDTLYETKLRDIIWQTSKSGLVNPVAVFDPVSLDGAITTKATLHNISYIEKLHLGIGDTIRVYRSNMVIPKIHDNLTQSNSYTIPTVCPECGGKTEIHNDNGSKTLHCTNPNCSAKLLYKLKHFCSRDAVNIDGMSEATLQKFINLGFIKNFKDIFYLNSNYNDIISLNGFGNKSTDKLLRSINESRKITLSRFIYSLSIPLVGRTVSKAIESLCGTFSCFIELCDAKYDWTHLEGVGNEISISIEKYYQSYKDEILELAKEFTFEEIKHDETDTKSSLNGKTFVVTGSVNHFANRNELKEKIENLGGKVSSSVSSKTDYLINNDLTSNSSKNKKAKELNIPIISEDDFLKLIN